MKKRKEKNGVDNGRKSAIISNVLCVTDIAGLCKGSTTDSDSVCEGSNPSPAAIVGAKYALLRRFLCLRQKRRHPHAPLLLLSAKRHAWLACSVASALTTARCRYHLFAGNKPPVSVFSLLYRCHPRFTAQDMPLESLPAAAKIRSITRCLGSFFLPRQLFRPHCRLILCYR